MKYFLLIIFLLTTHFCFSQVADSIPAADSAINIKHKPGLTDILNESNNLNFKATPVDYTISKRNYKEDDFNFYIIIGIVFFFSLIRAIFPKYYSNIFRVFFNASLRQGQLTDQLIQAKLSSLFYNVFFILSFTIYIYYIFLHLKIIENENNYREMIYIFISMLMIYIFKWIIIKFIGWLTNYKKVADNYLFVVFLLNKVLGICLLPLTIVIAFSNHLFVDIAAVISYVVILIVFGLRYLKMYESLANRINLNKFHFLLFLFALEILPLMLISKTAVYLLAK